MKVSGNFLEVFEFREEDELPEVAARIMNSKFRNTRHIDHECSFLDGGGARIHSKGIHTVICEDANRANLDLYHDATGSFDHPEFEDFANEKTLELNCDLSDKFEVQEEAAEIKLHIVKHESGFPSMRCSLIPGDTVCLKDQINSTILEPSLNEEFDHVSSDTEESSTSSEVPSSDNCFSGWDSANDAVGITFYPDYIDYLGTHYPDSMVHFSNSFVEIKSKSTYGVERSFHVQLEIDDIIKIESQWSACYEMGTMNICFIPKSAALDNTVCNASDSRIRELKFPAVDSKWYEKQEAIESLDVRYKALWCVMLDTGMGECSVSPYWKESMLTRPYFPNFDKPFDEVIYPKGDPDAVSISKRDVDLLQPDTFVNDTIIDFYIKYLKNTQNVEERSRFHFFNSFFFRKLADMDKDPSSAFDGKAAFLRVRKWTRKVNLLEKDFIFIPVNYNYHWSLIVICYFGEVAGNTDRTDGEAFRVPCILHMDSFRGSHMGLKDLMQSYLWEEWKERQKETCEDHLSLKFKNLKFISLELPQQQNSYDCGLFLLHYVELFLEDVPLNFNIHSITASSNFLQTDWFPPGEASMKRAHIERLIYELLKTHFEHRSPSSRSDGECSSINLKTATACEKELGIEMTLLPVSSTSSTKCTKNSRLIMKDLFEPGCASGLFDDVHSLDEMRSHLPHSEEGVEPPEPVPESAKPVSHHAVGLTPYTLLFSHTSDFKFEPDPNAVLADPNLSPSTSGGVDSENASEVEGADVKCRSFEAVGFDYEQEKLECIAHENIEPALEELMNGGKSCDLVGIEDHEGILMNAKHFPGFCGETNQILNNCASSHELLPNCSSFPSGEPLDATVQGYPDQTSKSNNIVCAWTLDSKDLPAPSSYQGNNVVATGVDFTAPSESHLLRDAKRMRFTHTIEDGENNFDVLNDLHL